METLKSKKVLIVDDEEDLREILKDEFESAGAAVAVAQNGLEAFELAQKTSFDLVVSDIRMPKADGVALLKKIRAVNPKVPVVILISGFNDYSPNQLIEFGAFKILSKPMAASKVVEVAATAFDS